MDKIRYKKTITTTVIWKRIVIMNHDFGDKYRYSHKKRLQVLRIVTMIEAVVRQE
ncbi:hypothetical protein HMPREF9413_2291 [Paenibacillus sp. HGF7]|nr:hypothetical protein HMPREF9413_2291 [Paenibacillus sp. HGF7]